MVGWHHWLNGHEFEQTLGDSEGQGRLACCNLCGHKVSDMTVTEQQQYLMHAEMAHSKFWTFIFVLTAEIYSKGTENK